MKIKIKDSDYLSICFYLSVSSIVLGIILTALLNKFISFYYVSYVIIFGLFFEYIVGKKKLTFNKNVFYLTTYLLLVTLPITLYNNHYAAFLIFFKNTFLFIPIYIYFSYKLNSFLALIKALKTLYFAGILASIYIIFEFTNKLLNFFPSWTNMTTNYLRSMNNTQLLQYSETNNIDILTSIIRPLGFEINFTAGAFYISSIFLIHLFSGYRFIRSKWIQKCVLLLLYFGILVSTSRQIIYIIHFILLINIIYYLFWNKSGESFVKLNLAYITVIFFSLLLIIFTSVYVVYGHVLVEVNGGTSVIILNDLKHLPETISHFISVNTFGFLFGIGGYTPNLPGLYYTLMPVNEIHFLLDLLYSLGLYGVILFFLLFVKIGLNMWKLISHKSSVNRDTDLAIFWIIVLFLMNIIHYSPIGLFNNFIIAFILWYSIFNCKKHLLI